MDEEKIKKEIQERFIECTYCHRYLSIKGQKNHERSKMHLENVAKLDLVKDSSDEINENDEKLKIEDMQECIKDDNKVEIEYLTDEDEVNEVELVEV